MNKILKKLPLILTVFFLSFSLVSLALAAPPDHARGANKEGKVNVPPGLQEKGAPPGLVNKGGLPPGLHGRTVDALPPGIRNNPNFQEAVERLRKAEEEPVFFIVGSEYIAIPDEGTKTQQYTAFLRDEDGTKNEVTASWSLDNGQAGEVSIDTNGLLSVTHSVYDTVTVTVTAAHTVGEADDEESYSAQLEVVVYHPLAEDIVISGAAEITLPEKGEKITEDYEAVVVDQHGQEMDKTISWVLEKVTGVTLDNKTLTIMDDAEAGSFKLNLSSGDLKKEFEITLTEDEEEEPE